MVQNMYYVYFKMKINRATSDNYINQIDKVTYELDFVQMHHIRTKILNMQYYILQNSRLTQVVVRLKCSTEYYDSPRLLISSLKLPMCISLSCLDNCLCFSVPPLDLAMAAWSFKFCNWPWSWAYCLVWEWKRSII